MSRYSPPAPRQTWYDRVTTGVVMGSTLRLCVLATAILVSNGFLLDTITNHIPHEVCYGDLGCFHSGSPFWSIHRPLTVPPDSPDKIGTKFILHTRQTRDQASEEFLNYADWSTFENSHFDGSRKTKMIVHGFTHDGYRQWVLNMTVELLKHDDYNIIVVDWHKGATLPYEQATANTRVVGAQIARLIAQLNQHASTSIDKFHIIGHSLGAQIAGYAGERLTHLPRITGLDPASPYFEGSDIRVRLDPTDADFVDVIHTDGGGISKLGFGVSEKTGHVDFYPNGGQQQPGCATDAVDKLEQTSWTALHTMMNYYAAEETLACSHERSYYYFTESINSQCPFLAFPCSNDADFSAGKCSLCPSDGCAHMGLYADESSARGNVYLDTENHAPFCDFNYVVNISSSNEFDGKLNITLTGTGGTTGPIALMQQNEYHASSVILSKHFSEPFNLGNITSMTLHYEKLYMVFVSSYYPDDWNLNGIAVYNYETDQRLTFCAYHKTVSNHNSTTFAVKSPGSHCY